MLRATRVAAITGSTISAAISRIPTIRIETATVVAASTASTTLRKATGTPATRAPSSSSATPASARYRSAIVAEPGDPQRRDEREVGAGRRQDRAEEEAEEVDVERAGHRDQDDAGGDARVEDERERLVAGGVLPRAQPLDRAARRRSRRRARSAPAGARAGSRPRRPANATWPMPSPIRLSCRWTRKKPTAGASRPTIAPAANASRMNSRSSMGVGGVVPDAREVLRRAVEDDAAADEHEPLDEALDRSELVRDVEDGDRRARDGGGRAGRRAPPATRRRRRSSARRGRAATAGRRAPWR